MKRLNFFLLVASVMLLTITISCKNSNKPQTTETKQAEVPEAVKDIVGIEKLQTKIDYSKAENWLSQPTKATKPVDVFFVYPTMAGYRAETELCDIDDSIVVAGAKMVRKIQTSVFDESCNVYMPYYRQISMPKPGADYSSITDYLSGFDTADALDYYLNNLNEGRPFILAGHSQGSSTLIALLENYMTKHPDAMKRMVAAYPIGFAVTKDWLNKTGFKFAEGATDTGVIVSWNTEGPGNQESTNFVLQPGAVSINPINWKRDDTYAPAKDNLGSLDNNTGRIVTPGIADARVDTVRGSVIVTTVNPEEYAIQGEGIEIFGPECYHRNDYGFFYNNLKQNIADRIAAFTKK